jgi:hypothetical protein
VSLEQCHEHTYSCGCGTYAAETSCGWRATACARAALRVASPPTQTRSIRADQHAACRRVDVHTITRGSGQWPSSIVTCRQCRERSSMAHVDSVDRLSCLLSSTTATHLFGLACLLSSTTATHPFGLSCLISSTHPFGDECVALTVCYSAHSLFFRALHALHMQGVALPLLLRQGRRTGVDPRVEVTTRGATSWSTLERGGSRCRRCATRTRRWTRRTERTTRSTVSCLTLKCQMSFQSTLYASTLSGSVVNWGP